MSAARRRLGDRGRTAGERCLRAARLRPGGDAGAAVRVPRARPVRPGARAALQQRQAAPRSVRACDQRGGPVGRGGVRLPLRRTRTAQRPRLGPAHDDVGRGQPVLRLGRRPAPPDGVPPHGDLRGPCEGPDHAAPGPPGGAARHLRGPRAPGADRAPHRARGDRAGADAGPSVRQRPPAGRHGPQQLLGLQHGRLLRPAQRVRLLGRPRPAGAGVQVGRQGAARGGDRGDPGRGLQPHRRGQPSGPDAVLQGAGQPLVLPAGRRPPLLHGHHGDRELAAHAVPARPPADHGLAAVLGHRDARRRLPLRPRGHPGPAVPRGGPAVRVLRPHPAGPRDHAASS